MCRGHIAHNKKMKRTEAYFYFPSWVTPNTKGDKINLSLFVCAIRTNILISYIIELYYDVKIMFYKIN